MAGMATMASRSAIRGLGFVCTGMTVDGMPGLEGYYFDYGRPIAEDERVRFAYGEEECRESTGPSSPGSRPRSWPEERRQRTFRSYALEYLRTMLPTLQELLGPADAQAELGRVARLVGLQFHEETARDMDLPTDVERGDLQSARDFARWLSAMLAREGEEIETTERDGAVTVRQSGWRAARELTLADPLKAFDAWNELWLGAAAAHDRFLAVQTSRASANGAGRSPGGSRRGSGRQEMAGDGIAEVAERQPTHLKMLVAQRNVAAPTSRQVKGRMRTKRPSFWQHLEQIFVESASPTSTEKPVSSRTSRVSAAR